MYGWSWVSACIAFELDGLALTDHDGTSGVVKDDGRDPDRNGDVSRDFLSHS